MSTIKTTNLQHPSAASPNLVLAADGSVSGGAGLGGLVLVSPTSIANSGGSASASGGAVTFTGVSSVSLNGVFSSAYQNYRITLTATHSTASVPSFRFRASGSDLSGSNYYYKGLYWASSIIVDTATNTYMLLNNGSATTTDISWDCFDPVPAKTKRSVVLLNDMTGLTGAVFNNLYNATNAADGFTVFPSSGTLTGTLRVYGYKNS